VAFTGGFAVAPIITLPGGSSPLSMQVTNTTYAALAVRDGNRVGGTGKRSLPVLRASGS
jgi:hypothetical protein